MIVTLTEKDSGVLVRMDHKVPDDPSWSRMGETFRENWAVSLENLKSVLETGIDLRIAQRLCWGCPRGFY